MDLVPLLSSFGIVALAELGDKTQLAVIGLSPEGKSNSVFIGALLAFALVDGVSALIGGSLSVLIPTFWIGLGAGTAFILFGVYTLLSKKAQKISVEKRPLSLVSSFSLIALMELGDKTQLAVIALAAEYEAPVLVFLGVMLAFTVLTGLGVTLGVAISRFVPLRYVKIGASFLFILFGAVFLWSAISGTKLF